MSDTERKPSHVALEMLEKELEQVELTKQLIISLELREAAPDFFEGKERGCNITVQRVGNMRKCLQLTDQSTGEEAYVPLSDLPKFTLENLGVTTRNPAVLQPLDAEMYRRKREAVKARRKEKGLA
tara:strand:+ start:6540 stop:6917 length:378 start_codon:yes stop_codon:yes gene_type:complete